MKIIRVSVLHKKVQELRNEKLNILKRAEIDRMGWRSKQQLLLQLQQVRFSLILLKFQVSVNLKISKLFSF